MNPKSVAGALVATLLACASAAAEDEKVTIDAFSVWDADARVIQTGADQATFVGTMTGLVFVDGEKGPTNNGIMSCAGTIDLALDSGEQKGSGRCTLTAPDGAKVFGSWTCEGLRLVGCQGPFTITGGTGRLQGISGQGPVNFRSSIHELALGADGGVAQHTTGIAFWRKLELTLPAK